ncbi:MAG: alkaline phosphatase family protein [Prevotella sp.]|nr:alkaline phosphatase family protein [Prevotella sp.]
MNRRQFTSALIALIAATVQAQVAQQSPRLVVNIAIDQLSSEYIEQFGPYFGTNGFKELMQNGTVYSNVSYPFSPVDRASAIASIMTGTTPYYNGIIGTGWLDKKTLRPISCVDDPTYPGVYTTEFSSPKSIRTSTITDELKVATQGKGLVYAIANEQDAAILSAGHDADGAFWKDTYNGGWCTTTYFMKSAPQWLDAFNQTSGKGKKTEFEQITELTNLAVLCIEQTGMGHDDVTDMLNITLDASVKKQKDKKNADWQANAIQTYINLDRQLADLIATIQSKVGRGNVLFLITGTGHQDIPLDDYVHHRVPTGSFYINRTANLLNLYLGALYGSDTYVRGCWRNHIYLNVELIEKKRLKLSEILQISQSFLLQCEGIINVHTSESLLTASDSKTDLIRNGFNTNVGGHLLIEVAPGWQLFNENTNEHYQINARTVNFPLIILGAGVKPQRIATPITVDRIAPTIATTIHIRAPNACAASPLF